MERRSREEVIKALGLREDPGGITELVLNALLTKPLPFRARLSDSGGKGHVQGLSINAGKARPGPKGKLVPGPAAFYASARVGRAGPVRQVWLGKVGVLQLVDARVAARAVLNQLHQGIDPNKMKAEQRVAEQSRVLVRKYVVGDYYTGHLKNRKSGEAEKDRLLSAWKDILDLRLDEVTAKHLNDVLQKRRDEGLAPGTLLRDWNSVRAMLRQAVEDGVLAAVPFKAQPPALSGLQGTKRVRWLGQEDADEVRRFEEALSNETAEVRSALLLAALTGMRRGELLGLKRSEVRLRDGVILIPPERSKSGRERIVRLNTQARELLKGFTVHGVDGSYFPGNVSTWRQKLKRAMARIRRDGNLTDLTLHDLRHTYAVRLRQAGAALEVVRDALGHADLVSTQRYAHVAEQEVRAAVEKVRL
jgi:integrase